MQLLLKIFLLTALTTLTLTASIDKPSCGGKTSSRDILLINPKNPPRECVYKINAYSKNVCQLRLDLKYNLAQPSVPDSENDLKYVKCERDYFRAGTLRLCGTELQQHIYLPFNATAGVKNLELSLVLANRVKDPNLPIPKWNITIKQLECFSSKDGFLMAPSGCLQYFPETKGKVTSFNFNQGKGHPGKINYAICFRRSDYTKALRLKFYYFVLGSHIEDQSALNYCYGDPLNNANSSNYLMIPHAEMSIISDQPTSSLCGSSTKEAEVVSTNPGPLIIIFNSDGLYTKESGFSFSYKLV